MDHVMDTEARPAIYFGDDAKLLCDILAEDWPDTPGEPRPQFVYEREKLMMDSRYGSVFVYLISSQRMVSDTDFRTADRMPRLAIKLSCRSRELMFRWARIIESILQSRRRAMRAVSPYTYLEVTNERPDNSADGWYTYTYDIKLTGYHVPILGSGVFKPSRGYDGYDEIHGGP